jgi:hypothetical protein
MKKHHRQETLTVLTWEVQQKIELTCFWCLAAQGTNVQQPFTFTAIAFVVASNESTTGKNH